MPADIERIVDRKLIKQRVHYFVVWKGFGEENNTWESRIDLMADGYSDVIKRFEEQRKKESGASTPRGRSPGRSTSKSPRKSKSPGRSPGRPRGRRSRSRSASVSRKLPESNNDEEKDVKEKETTSPSATTPRRRKSPSNNENNHEANGTVKETPRRRSTRKQAATETASTQFVSRLDEQKADPATDEEDDSVLLRSTIAALAPQVREMAPPAPLAAETSASKKSVTLSYEEDEDAGVLLKAQSAVESTTSESSATISPVLEHTGPVQDSFVAKVVESGYLASILSVAAVVGSLVASQMLPRDSEEGTELWRRWLPFLTPVVALLLFFHQKDGRSSAKWVATGLSWRAAAELLLLIGSTPREFETMVAGSAVLANLSLLIALVSILRNGEHVQSKATLALLTVGTLTLFLSDSWVISTENSELESRVVLMSMAVLTIALSPTPTVSSEEDD
ncbi:putative chromodomain protein [Phytophthora cinnamomi]|uniref:putative chromodomain protein n=1 Tax=Phytophthora cinnamomi TaxID=4785 RepID=UPI00355A04B9|nr:putative chromodomain protein [Phytophthora cinnamomi]